MMTEVMNNKRQIRYLTEPAQEDELQLMSLLWNVLMPNEVQIMTVELPVDLGGDLCKETLKK
jgi:hypothetical protein